MLEGLGFRVWGLGYFKFLVSEVRNKKRECNGRKSGNIKRINLILVTIIMITSDSSCRASLRLFKLTTLAEARVSTLVVRGPWVTVRCCQCVATGHLEGWDVVHVIYHLGYITHGLMLYNRHVI